jgi:hypothetical protein
MWAYVESRVSVKFKIQKPNHDFSKYDWFHDFMFLSAYYLIHVLSLLRESWLMSSALVECGNTVIQ